MKEIRDIIKAYHTASGKGKRTALATVVQVEGSSYRRPGARMLVDEEGQFTGAISGGCLEGDALRKALLVLAQSRSKLVTYDTRNEEEAEMGAQLGCEGVIQVLFEPIDSSLENHPIALLERTMAKRQRAVVATFFQLDDKSSPQHGTCIVWEENDQQRGMAPNGLHTEIVLRDMQSTLLQGFSQFCHYTTPSGALTAFLECVEPPISLVVVGAGNDAIPLTAMAAILGWDVQVVDGRSTHAHADRFSSGCQILVAKPAALMEKLRIDHRTAMVLMTHNYHYDRDVLRWALTQPIAYIGLLGPKKKKEKMLDELKRSGLEITPAMLARLYGPTGLDLGAETPEEIAISILSEILAVMQGSNGGMLRDKHSVIHDRYLSAGKGGAL